MKIASIELQKALYTELSKSYSVLDSVILASTFPCITFGADEITDSSLKVNKITTHNIKLHTWSKSNSSIENKTMIHTLMQLKDKDLIVDGFKIQSLKVSLTTTLIEPDIDFNIYHGVLEMKIIMEED